MVRKALTVETCDHGTYFRQLSDVANIPVVTAAWIATRKILQETNPPEQKWIKAQFQTLPLLPTPDSLRRDATHLGQQCRSAGFNAGSLDLVIARSSKLRVHQLLSSWDFQIFRPLPNPPHRIPADRMKEVVAR